MIIATGADHGGFHLKQEVIILLEDLQHTVLDAGAYTEGPSDYPELCRGCCLAYPQQKSKARILICGSGVGACIAANKFPGIRASVCHDTFSARQGVEDDDMNVLCLGARVIGPELAYEVVRAFIARNSQTQRVTGEG